MSVQVPVPSYNRVGLALLGTSVLPAKSEPYERVSAAMAVRAAISALRNPATLLFLVPEGTSSTARYILSGLLAGNYAHQHGVGFLPTEECQAFLTTQILFVTPAVSECVTDLQDVRLAGSTSLTDLWAIVPLAKQPPRASNKLRIFVANPGWATARIRDRKYSAVIIDATHPRTLHQLPHLASLAREQSSFCVIVAPVLMPKLIAELNANTPDVWIWDPLAQTNARTAVSGQQHPSSPGPNHTFYICSEDLEGDRLLADAHHEIGAASKLANGKGYPGLPLVWSILNRLRTLTVPLAAFEEAAKGTYGGGLASRMRMLDAVAGHGIAAWDATWPRVRTALDAAFSAFVKRAETAKFWVLAERLDKLLRSSHDPIRVVAPSKVEVELLTELLQEIVDAVSESLTDGRLEITTYRDEALRVADGQPAHALLLGARPLAYRHLNVYPSYPQEEVLYPFEVPLERASLERQYAAAEALQGDNRATLLERLHFSALAEIAGPHSPAPRRETVRADGQAVTIARTPNVDTELDLDWYAAGDDALRAYVTGENETVPRSGEAIDVTFAGGMFVRYPVEQTVDVYYQETDFIERVPAANLRPGMRMIRFVDGRYDSLFERTKEAINSKLPLRERMAIELWEISKRNLVRSHTRMQDLYEALCALGITSSYAACRVWFKEDEDTIAPQTFEDFIVIAKATKAFKTDKQIGDVFRCIQKVRGRNRSVGRQLHALLRAVVSRDGYEEALENVRKIDPNLADVFAAVDVAEIESVQRGR
jgi:hypothetical protein